MQTIIVVGHPYSGYQVAENLLYRYGMKAAKVSRTQKLTPQEVCEHLLLADEITAECARNFEQSKPGKVWQGLGLDLFMGNLDGPFWGWADPKAIHTLDYWKEADSNINFVLIYNSPEFAWAKSFHKKLATDDDWNGFLNEWCAYNAALMHFYNRNVGRCLLAHAGKIFAAPSQFIDEAATRFGVVFSQPEVLPDLDESSDALDGFLAKAMLEGQPEAVALYEELQASASLPLHDEPNYSPILAWRICSELRQETVRLEQARQALQAQLASAIAQLGNSSNNKSIVNKGLEQENQLLITQLHQAQEELERNYLDSRKFVRSVGAASGGTDKVSRMVSLAKRPDAHYGAADRIKKQLSYRLGATMIAHSKSLTGWLGMPLAIIKQVREFESDRLARGAANLPPISSYRDAHEAAKVKQHLSYRLGSIMLNHSRSPVGWIKMPLALAREVKEFKHRRQVS